MALYNSNTKNILFRVLLFSIPVFALVLVSNSSGRSGFNTGSPGEGGNTCTQCHIDDPQDYGAALSITTTIPEAGYELNTSYDITVAISSSASRHGFQIVAERLSDNIDVGTFSAGSNSQLVNNGVHVTHVNANSTNWTFSWTSPATDEGPIKFYAASVAGNGNGTNKDQVVTAQTEASDILHTDNPEETQLQSYPNPVIDDFFIDLPQSASDASFTLFDMNGNLILSGSLLNSSNLINLSKLTKGVYVVTISVDGKTASKEIIKE